MTLAHRWPFYLPASLQDSGANTYGNAAVASERPYSLGPRLVGKQWVFEDAICGRLPVGKSLAALGVIELTKQKLLDRIRHCICGNWFFARFAHQHSCSAKCRHKNYEQTEEFKASRRTYMRNYYKLKTSGKVK